jgi:hypothetical protein
MTSTLFTPLRRAAPLLLALGVSLLAGPAGAAATSPAQLLAEQQKLAGTTADATRGRAFFTSRHGREWSCSSCHGEAPIQPGKHASTGKAIGPLAPAFNAERFSDTAKTEKWFRRNCNDVVGRECSPAEKADVLAFLITLKP